jgi:hypothetical protein
MKHTFSFSADVFCFLAQLPKFSIADWIFHVHFGIAAGWQFDEQQMSEAAKSWAQFRVAFFGLL